MTGHKQFQIAYIVKDRSAINYLTAFAERVLVVFEGLASTEVVAAIAARGSVADLVAGKLRFTPLDSHTQISGS